MRTGQSKRASRGDGEAHGSLGKKADPVDGSRGEVEEVSGRHLLQRCPGTLVTEAGPLI